MNTITRTVIVLGLNCLLSLAVFQNKPHTDLDKDDLLGPVHTVKVVKTLVSPLNVRTKDNSYSGSQITIYSPVGNITEEQYFDSARVLRNKRVFNYSASGRLAEVIEYGADGLVISKTIHTPNTTKNPIEVEEAYYDRQGQFLSKQVRVYSEQGRPVKLFAYNPSGVINETTSSYDTKGNAVETWQWVISNEKRNLLSRATYAYLDDDRKTVATYFDPDGTQVGSLITNKNRDGSNIKIEHRDAKGNLVDAKLIVRKFDSMGNWIVENVFQEYPKNGSANLVEITNRTITYY